MTQSSFTVEGTYLAEISMYNCINEGADYFIINFADNIHIIINVTS